MKTQLIQDPPSAEAAGAAPPATGEPSPQRRRRRPGLIATGAVMGLGGLVLLAGGTALVAVHGTQRDGAGLYSSAAGLLETPARAIVAESGEVGSTGAADLFVLDHLIGDVQVTAEAAGGEALFVGVGPQDEVDAYLSGVERSVVDDLEVGPVRATFKGRSGSAAPAAPAGQPFWIERSQGTGTQTVRWQGGEGEWAVVVMRPDGARGVRAQVGVGAEISGVLPIGIALLAIGLGLAAGGVAVGLSGSARRVHRRPWTPGTRT